jgi:hypothetical protein
MSTDIITIGHDQYDLTTIDDDERSMITEAADLNEKYPNHAIIDLWDASVHNLRKRVEIYSIEMFLSALNLQNTEYNKDGTTIPERWRKIKDSSLIEGAYKLRLISEKTYTLLNAINNVRNNHSAAHETFDPVTSQEVICFAGLLFADLFEKPMPANVYIPKEVFEKLKNQQTETQLMAIAQTIASFDPQSISNLYGFAKSSIINGEKPIFQNISFLFPTLWQKFSDVERRDFGHTFASFFVDGEADQSKDKKAKERMFSLIVDVKGFADVPEQVMFGVYRNRINALSSAKDSMYGWGAEDAAAEELVRLGPNIPPACFDLFFSEYLRVYCGNVFGCSNASHILQPFMEALTEDEKVRVCGLFCGNVLDELAWNRPKEKALSFLSEIKTQCKSDESKRKIDETAKMIMALKAS